MDAENYSIGNFISHKNEISKITMLHKDYVPGLDYCYLDHKTKEKCWLINVNPIPLSLSWLKKAGYKQLKRVEKTYSLSDYEDNSAIMFTGVRFIHIRTQIELTYLHEWQNLYSAIFKKELKFKL